MKKFRDISRDADLSGCFASRTMGGWVRAAAVVRLLLVVAAAGAAGAGAGASRPLAHPTEGAVEGLYMKSASGKTFAAFRGIPYASPPVGDNRFKKSEPMGKWSGVWNATDYGSPCLQHDFTFTPDQEQVIGDEDCLFVNVFTPQLPKGNKNPKLNVFVYIHGGALVHGTASLYGPKLLMDYDVVSVTFNYRLGILGFLSTEDEVVPGNNGLKDQALALKWIKNNIAAFGGNPESITIAGTSAGGASVHFHYLSPYSKGLFNRGLSISGTALVPWCQGYKHREKANKMAALLGCPTECSKALVECLKTRPARQIVTQTKHFQSWRFNPFNPFGPIIPEPGSSPFLSKQPVDMILNGEAQDLPWITSITTEEGLYPAGEFALKEDALKDLDERFDAIAPHLLLYNYTVAEDEKKSVSDKIRKYYLQDRPISSETRDELIQMIGDRIFVVDVERAARLMARVNTQPVYFYVFSYRGAESISDCMSRTRVNMGVAHGDDTGYIMHMPFINTETTEEDRTVIKLMIDICKNFAKNDNPTPTKKNVQWTPVRANSKELDYLSIASSSKIEMKSSADLGKRAFWDSLPINEPQILAYKRQQRNEL